jgi:hypothetical protein
MKSEYQYTIKININIVAANERDAIVQLYEKLENLNPSTIIKDHVTLDRSVELGSAFNGLSDELEYDCEMDN